MGRALIGGAGGSGSLATLAAMRRASSRVKMLIDAQGGGDHTHCILLRRWYESRRLVTRVTFLALAALHSSTAPVASVPQYRSDDKRECVS